MRPQTPYGKAKMLGHLAVMHYRCFVPSRLQYLSDCGSIENSFVMHSFLVIVLHAAATSGLSISGAFTDSSHVRTLEDFGPVGEIE